MVLPHHGGFAYVLELARASWSESFFLDLFAVVFLEIREMGSRWGKSSPISFQLKEVPHWLLVWSLLNKRCV